LGVNCQLKNPFEVRQTPHLAARDTLKENKSPEESIDHSNPFEIKHVPANYAIRDTLLVKKPIPITSKRQQIQIFYLLRYLFCSFS
jgi:hypothetical protein